jgi:hypothetical protein
VLEVSTKLYALDPHVVVLTAEAATVVKSVSCTGHHRWRHKENGPRAHGVSQFCPHRRNADVHHDVLLRRRRVSQISCPRRNRWTYRSLIKDQHRTCMYTHVQTAGRGNHAHVHVSLLARGRDHTPIFISAGPVCPAPAFAAAGRTYMTRRRASSSLAAGLLDQHYMHMLVGTCT